MQKLLAATGLTMTLLLPMRVEAEMFFEPRDFTMLPAYCKHTKVFNEEGRGDPAEYERWLTVMGPTFHHMHHYCYGLVQTNRATFFSRTPEERTSNLAYSLGEFDYVIDRALPHFVMLPEIHTKKGENLIRLGEGSRGMREFLRAIELKPDYWPPYAYISDYYKKLGDVVSARKWLEKGLSVLPNAKALTQRLTELDGPKDLRKTAPGPARKPAATPPPE
jgi:tetratricopeptide (TPR) repeat protein